MGNSANAPGPVPLQHSVLELLSKQECTLNCIYVQGRAHPATMVNEFSPFKKTNLQNGLVMSGVNSPTTFPLVYLVQVLLT